MNRRHLGIVAVVALAARLAVVAWAAHAIPPSADGTYYEKLAERLAAGQGYTWLWPDGAVTYAAHYPVGYPALVALGYALFGVKPVVAMLLNAILGTAGAMAAWALVARCSPARNALAAGLAVALHPVLVPYTAALMTEGVTAAGLVIAAALASEARARRSWAWLAAMGMMLGLVTLVRPQSLVFAPILGAIAFERTRFPKRAIAAGLATALALGVCAPWTYRNCARMEKCALVSVNGGWNLAIGAQTNTGAWQEISVPDACKTVFQEAAKDTCFGDEAKKGILAHPGAWIARMPAKLRATFDYFGAAPWYLHTANPAAFPYEAKVALGSLETLASRLFLAAALVAVWRWRGPRLRGGDLRGNVRLRRGVVAVGLVACVLVPGTIGYLALAVGIVLAWRKLPVLLAATAVVILATAATHAVFFGAGRYGIVVVPFVTCLAFARRRVEA